MFKHPWALTQDTTVVPFKGTWGMGTYPVRLQTMDLPKLHYTFAEADFAYSIIIIMVWDQPAQLPYMF